MVAKTKQNATMWAGDHRELRFTVTDSDSASVDLTGCCAVWQLMEEEGGASLVKRLSDGACGIAISGCTFTVSLSPTHTDGLAGDYYHESWVRNTSDDESIVAVGWLRVRERGIV